jgi:nucleoside-diphosphate-sugar epimerase
MTGRGASRTGRSIRSKTKPPRVREGVNDPLNQWIARYAHQVYLAAAKIVGIKRCESDNRQFGTDFRSVMPTNLDGRGDNVDLANSLALPALIRKLHQAKRDGAPRKLFDVSRLRVLG